MVSGVSKDPSSVTAAVETIASVRAEKDLIIAALKAHSALLTKQLEAAMYLLINWRGGFLVVPVKVMIIPNSNALIWAR